MQRVQWMTFDSRFTRLLASVLACADLAAAPDPAPRDAPHTPSLRYTALQASRAPSPTTLVPSGYGAGAAHDRRIETGPNVSGLKRELGRFEYERFGGFATRAPDRRGRSGLAIPRILPGRIDVETPKSVRRSPLPGCAGRLGCRVAVGERSAQPVSPESPDHAFHVCRTQFPKRVVLRA